MQNKKEPILLKKFQLLNIILKALHDAAANPDHIYPSKASFLFMLP